MCPFLSKTPVFSDQREAVTWLEKVFRLGFRVGQGLDRSCPVVSRDSCGRRLIVNADSKGRPKRVRVVLQHLRQFQSFRDLPANTGADQAPGMLGHEVDFFRSNLASQTNHVPFGFPVFVVGHDYQAALFQKALSSRKKIFFILLLFSISNSMGIKSNRNEKKQRPKSLL